MNDFLKNLRSSHKKDSSDPKRNLDGHFYRKNDRRIIQDRRSIHSADSIDILLEKLTDLIPKISDNATVFSSFFEFLEIKSDRLIDAKIKQHEAVTQFFENMNRLIQTDNSAEKPPAKASASYATGTRYTKDEILDMMHSLRQQGKTFSQIADHLIEKGIPTFSGKGHWHAQTIHRLCK